MLHDSFDPALLLRSPDYALRQAEIIADDVLELIEERSEDVNSTIGGIARVFTGAFTGDVGKRKSVVVSRLEMELRDTLKQMEMFHDEMSCRRLLCTGPQQLKYVVQLHEMLSKAARDYSSVEKRNNLSQSAFSTNLQAEAAKLSRIHSALEQKGALNHGVFSACVIA